MSHKARSIKGYSQARNFPVLCVNNCKFQITKFGCVQSHALSHADQMSQIVLNMSSDTSYYVYALKDPRTSPAMPFYIGKGTGTRSFHHLIKPDATRKGLKIKEIEASGTKVLVSRLVDSLNEQQALKLEAELIAALGTVDSGGLLTNSVLPSGLSQKARTSVIVPSGVKEKAQVGLSLLKDAILELAKANPDGITNSDAASVLGLRSDYGGGSKDYLSYSILGILMREGKMERSNISKKHISRID